jgi:hypothetical protein
MLDRMLTEQILPNAKRHAPHNVDAYLRSGAPEEVFSMLRRVLEPMFQHFAAKPTKEEKELLKRHEKDGAMSLTFDGFMHFAQSCGLQEHQFSTELSTDFTVAELASIFVDAHPVQRVDRPGGIDFKEFTGCLLQMTLLASDVLDAPVARRRTNSASRYFARSRSTSSARNDGGSDPLQDRKGSRSMPLPEQTELLKQNILRFLLCITKNVVEAHDPGKSGGIPMSKAVPGAEAKKFFRIAQELETEVGELLHQLLMGDNDMSIMAKVDISLESIGENEEDDEFEPKVEKPQPRANGGFNASNFMSTLMSSGRKAEPTGMSPKVKPKKARTSFFLSPKASASADASPPPRGANGKKMSFFQVPSFGGTSGQSAPDKKKRSFLARNGAALARNAATSTTSTAKKSATKTKRSTKSSSTKSSSKSTKTKNAASKSASYQPTSASSSPPEVRPRGDSHVVRDDESPKPTSDPAIGVIREELVALYEKHAPNKMHTVDGLMRKYKGREKDLVRIVKRKYGAK